MREHMGTDIAAAHLVISGSDVMVCDGGELIDVMNRAGQGVLVNVLALGGVKSSLDHRIRELDGTGADPGAPSRRLRRRPCTAEAV